MLQKRELTLKQLSQNKNQVGKNGELLAEKYLRDSGFRILETNLRYKNHEVDLVVMDLVTREIVFVEVKTNTNNNFGHPSERFDYLKLKSLLIFAKSYLRERRLHCDFRFDIVAISPVGIEHFENVTW